jgi:DNA-binding NtrC family response regulator
MKTILAVDDRKNSLKVLAAILTDEGYRVIQATSAREALDIYAGGTHIDAVLSDFKMPGMDGLAMFKEMNARRKAPPVIIMSAYGTVKSAVQALKEGVTDYLIKPLDYEELSIVLAKAIREREMALELDSLKEQVRDEEAFHGIIGGTRQLRDIFELVRTVGPTDASVLIYGETGTGKELLARALHLESRRCDQNMICINSAALADDLLEAELFGYVKGAFTGAVADRKGRLEMADLSTLFLDEIGQMSLRLQSKLLRFLQEMAFEPVGSSVPRRVNVRIIAATNLDLPQEIERGRFLQDLLYRIDVINIKLPPLRDRREDIYLLVNHYIRRYAAKYEKPIQGIEPEAMKALAEYHWPGNIRELKNFIARGVILSKHKKLILDDLPDICSNSTHCCPAIGNRKALLAIPEDGLKIQDMEKELIRRTLADCGDNKSQAAQRLGISRKTLYEKIARYAIR